MSRKRLASIDSLRGIAVLAVMLDHLPYSTVLNPNAPDAVGASSVLPPAVTNVTCHGHFGVNLFLVISGFCIHLACAQGSRLGFRQFWWRRFHRLYPPYVAAILLTLAGLFFYHGVIRQHLSLPQAFGYADGKLFAVDLGSLVFQVQNVTGAGARIGNSPLWTLALEEQLYLLYFPLLWLRDRFSWPVVLATVALVVLGWRSVVVVGGLPAWCLALAPARWLEWTLGAMAADAYAGRATALRSFPSLLSAATVAAIAIYLGSRAVGDSAHRILTDSLMGVAAFSALSWWVSREQRGWAPGRFAKLLPFVGLFSYSIYLTHAPIYFGAKQIGLRLGLSVPGVLGLRVVLATSCAWLFFVVVESHFLRPAASKAQGALAGVP